MHVWVPHDLLVISAFLSNKSENMGKNKEGCVWQEDVQDLSPVLI